MQLRKLLSSLAGAQRSSVEQRGSEPLRFVLVLMRSSIGRHLEVLRELIELVAAGLSDLGYGSVAMVNEFAPGENHIVFCPHLLRAEDVHRVPPSTILYHYGYRGDWDTESIVLTVDGARHAGKSFDQLLEEVRSQRNVVLEMIATLAAVKPARKPGSMKAQPMRLEFQYVNLDPSKSLL